MKFSAGCWHLLPQTGSLGHLESTSQGTHTHMQAHVTCLRCCGFGTFDPLRVHSCPGAQRPWTVPHRWTLRVWVVEGGLVTSYFSIPLRNPLQSILCFQQKGPAFPGPPSCERLNVAQTVLCWSSLLCHCAWGVPSSLCRKVDCLV